MLARQRRGGFARNHMHSIVFESDAQRMWNLHRGLLPLAMKLCRWGGIERPGATGLPQPQNQPSMIRPLWPTSN